MTGMKERTIPITIKPAASNFKRVGFFFNINSLQREAGMNSHIIIILISYLNIIVRGITIFPSIACKNGAVRFDGAANTTRIPLRASHAYTN